MKQQLKFNNQEWPEVKVCNKCFISKVVIFSFVKETMHLFHTLCLLFIIQPDRSSIRLVVEVDESGPELDPLLAAL